MSDDEKPPSGRANEKTRPRVKSSSERPFDLWLQKQLHAMYDEIASEPLPADLLNLIDRDATKSGEIKLGDLKNDAHQGPQDKNRKK